MPRKTKATHNIKPVNNIQEAVRNLLNTMIGNNLRDYTGATVTINVDVDEIDTECETVTFSVAGTTDQTTTNMKSFLEAMA